MNYNKRFWAICTFIISSVVIYAINSNIENKIFSIESIWFGESATTDNRNAIFQSDCLTIGDLRVENIGINAATISWKASDAVEWEYYVQIAGYGMPSNSGITTTSKTVSVTSDQAGIGLLANTVYEYYVKAKCADNSSTQWIGPLSFQTSCDAIQTYPFTESFDTLSTSYDCWKIIDEMSDTNPQGGQNTWERSAQGPFKGDKCMYFYGFNNPNDSWLISPSFKMSGEVYELTYFYKATSYVGADVEVLISQNGKEIKDFKTVLMKKTAVINDNYVQKRLYIYGLTGDINIAWHINNNGLGMFYLDEVKLEKVDCVIPDEDVVISDLVTNKATVTWTDNVNSSWEYFVKPIFPAGLPSGSGLNTTNKSVVINRTNGSGATNLQPDTYYEFYVRSECNSGKKSNWVGPILFKTPCINQALPFWEGFNSNSTTSICWNVVDNDKNAKGTGAFVSNKWIPSTGKYEGNGSMYYSGGPRNDDWLISPTFNLNSTKKYRLKYFYKTNSYNNTDFEVLLSTKGVGITDFTQKLISKKGYNNDNWVEETVYISGISGDVNIAWHINTLDSNSAYQLDDISFKEVTCPEPIMLATKDVASDTATLIWKDDFGSNWEYIVQQSGGAFPAGKGNNLTKNEVKITLDRYGKKLIPNTEYEYYVRSVCSLTETSTWSGPYKFRTLCMPLDLPFWEGFNTNSESLFCWTINDVNGDANGVNGKWTKHTLTPYEGNNAMYFSVTDTNKTIESDDWLISPIFNFEPGKMYRLRYFYKANTTNTTNEFEVLASNNGTAVKDFKTVLVPNTNYTNSAYIEKKIFISGLSGDINLAWHIKGKGSKTIFIDNIFVEEVIGCEEPMKQEVQNIDKHSAELTWIDDSGANSWEYYVQEASGALPKTSGISTKSKINVITKDNSGITLQANTKYEYFVRSLCTSGKYSIWLGPFEFTTLCDVYQTPFLEGFNSTSTSMRCWTVLDKLGSVVPFGVKWKINQNAKFEGDQAMYYANTNTVLTNFDDWLISPTIDLDGGMYVLKYRYQTNAQATAANEFEVLLSTSGITPANFTTSIVSKKKYVNDTFSEEVVFINGIKGNINLAWHINALNTKASYLLLDNISLQKVNTCPEPYYVKISNETSTSFDLNWEQQGGITSWDIIVVKSGDSATAIPIKSATVNGNPTTTISGLPSGQGYSVYVKAKCLDGKSASEWSSPVNGGTKIGLNDECNGAVTIPVNKGNECFQKVSGTILGATISPQVIPACAPALNIDVWFEFTASSIAHLLTMSELKSISGAAYPTVSAAIYDQPCGSTMTTPMACTLFNSTTAQDWVIGNLIPGQKYYVRFGVAKNAKAVDFTFDLCLTSSQFSSIEILPSGTKQEIEDLVKNVLINSNCDLVSNVKYQNGDGGPNTQKYNTLGYFNKAGSTFPFEKGIVLSTNEIEYLPRPYMGYNVERGQNNERWVGDKDINDAIKNAGGGPKDIKRVTQIEFDFLAIKDSLKFEYLFASNSYHKTCGDACNVGALFAAWLVDSTTGEGINLAKVPNTNLPIAINTIRNSTMSGANCVDVNPNLFGQYYDNVDKAIDAPIDFVGLTKPLSSETVLVVPGRSYHIKLAVIDFCPTVSHSSAVFFKAGSFDLGNLDLGRDLTIANGNALCQGTTKIIESGVSDYSSNTEISWYKDGIEIVGENKANLEVKESGDYSVTVKYINISCEVSGQLKVEMFPMLSDIINLPENLEICRFNTGDNRVDLTSVELNMFKANLAEEYQVHYFKDKLLTNRITMPEQYLFNIENNEEKIFIEVINKNIGCSAVFDFKVIKVQGDLPQKPNDVDVCTAYTLPILKANQYYFSESGGKGKNYQNGEVLQSGTYVLYLYQDNGEGCFEEVVFKVVVAEEIVVNKFENVVEQCRLYELIPLPSNQRYEIVQKGQRVVLHSGDKINQTNTIVYVVSESANGLCKDESQFKVTYLDCPIPKGFSPNGDGANDSFDLSEHGATSLKIFNRNGTEVYSFEGNYTNQWTGKNKTGKELVSGTYYYVIQSITGTKTGWVQINK